MNKPRLVLWALLLALGIMGFAGPPGRVNASGSLTLPFSQSGVAVNSWFDHNLPGSGNNDNMVRYDGVTWTDGSAYLYVCGLGYNCYDGHNGIDFGLSSGSSVVASAAGVVQFVGWQDPNPAVGYGFYVRVWHAGLNLSTIYGHLSENYLVSQNQSVSRGQLLGISDNTGFSTGAHLHLTVLDAQSGGHPIDPYGWSGGGADPWSYNQGYLWSAKADKVIWRPGGTAYWWVSPWSGSAWNYPLGTTGDLTVPGDHNGDGKDDFVVWKPSGGSVGQWKIHYTNGATDPSPSVWGTTGDKPQPGNFSGDGRADKAVFRPSTGTWWIRPTGGGSDWSYPWGAGTDIPIPGDFDGDGKQDLVTYRPSNGTWWIHPSGGGGDWSNTFGGVSGDIPVSADFNGDGKTDIALWRPSTGYWWVRPTGGGADWNYPWGSNGDIPVPADFDGDGKDDLIVWRPSTGTWWIHPTGGGANWSNQFGQNGDKPQGGDFASD